MKSENSRQYILRLFDKPLLSFHFAEGPLGFTEIVIDWCDDTSVHLLPASILHSRKVAGEQICEWLLARFIPQDRKNAKSIYLELGVAPYDVRGLIDICKGLSLNDSYWVADESFEGSFDNVNLYDNDFSEELGKLAISGRCGSILLDPRSPELTTGGSLPKAWRIVDGKRVLLKGASTGPAHDAGEQSSEFLASQIAQRMGLDAVEYDLTVWDGMLCSTCELFNTKELSYVPMRDAFKGSAYSAFLGAAWRCLGTEAFESLASMLVFDSVIINTDRHLANFGVLRDNATGRFASLAPVFDNGRSLFYLINDDGCNRRNFDTEAWCLGPKWFARSFDSIASGLMGERQKEQLARLKGLELKQHPEHQVSQLRLDALNDFIQRRVDTLLAMPCVDREQLMSEVDKRSDVCLPMPEELEVIIGKARPWA